MRTFPKGCDEQISKHFKAREFDCHCGACSQTLIDDDLMSKLDAVRDALGVPMSITSGNRCQAYQDKLKAEGYETALGVSQHTLGMAADFKTGSHTGEELEIVARNFGFMAVGVGSEFVHVDLRIDKARRWTYSY